MAGKGYSEVGLSALILAGFLVSIGSAIHCWECNSRYDPNCGDTFKNHTISLADCSQRFPFQDTGVEASICRKITQIVQGETRIIRSCGYLDPEDAGHCVSRAGTHQVYVHYCQCAGEGCNRTSGLAPSPLLLLLLLHLFAFFFFSTSCSKSS